MNIIVTIAIGGSDEWKDVELPDDIAVRQWLPYLATVFGVASIPEHGVEYRIPDGRWVEVLAAHSLAEQEIWDGAYLRFEANRHPSSQATTGIPNQPIVGWTPLFDHPVEGLHNLSEQDGDEPPRYTWKILE